MLTLIADVYIIDMKLRHCIILSEILMKTVIFRELFFPFLEKTTQVSQGFQKTVLF